MNGLVLLRERRSPTDSLETRAGLFNVPGPPEKPPRALGGVVTGTIFRPPRLPRRRNPALSERWFKGGRGHTAHRELHLTH
jgi:hypothetical protein